MAKEKKPNPQEKSRKPIDLGGEEVRTSSMPKPRSMLKFPRSLQELQAVLNISPPPSPPPLMMSGEAVGNKPASKTAAEKQQFVQDFQTALLEEYKTVKDDRNWLSKVQNFFSTSSRFLRTWTTELEVLFSDLNTTEKKHLLDAMHARFPSAL